MFNSADIHRSYRNLTRFKRCGKSRGGAACVPIDMLDEGTISEPERNRPDYAEEKRVNERIIRRSR